MREKFGSEDRGLIAERKESAKALLREFDNNNNNTEITLRREIRLATQANCQYYQLSDYYGKLFGFAFTDQPAELPLRRPLSFVTHLRLAPSSRPLSRPAAPRCVR